MPESAKDLGKLINTHGTSSAFLQRASIVALVSFLFFLVMLVVFYMRQQFGYFLLSSAFLIVYLFTMIGMWMQKRNSVKIYENGIAYKKFQASWDELVSVKADGQTGIMLSTASGEKTTIPPSITALNTLALIIRTHLS